jgi:hypothetical protein
MKAKLVAHFEIDNSFFKDTEEENLFNSESRENKITWLKNKCLEASEYLMESDIELVKFSE